MRYIGGLGLPIQDQIAFHTVWNLSEAVNLAYKAESQLLRAPAKTPSTSRSVSDSNRAATDRGRQFNPQVVQHQQASQRINQRDPFQTKQPAIPQPHRNNNPHQHFGNEGSDDYGDQNDDEEVEVVEGDHGDRVVCVVQRLLYAPKHESDLQRHNIFRTSWNKKKIKLVPLQEGLPKASKVQGKSFVAVPASDFVDDMKKAAIRCCLRRSSSDKASTTASSGGPGRRVGDLLDQRRKRQSVDMEGVIGSTGAGLLTLGDSSSGLNKGGPVNFEVGSDVGPERTPCVISKESGRPVELGLESGLKEVVIMDSLDNFNLGAHNRFSFGALRSETPRSSSTEPKKRQTRKRSVSSGAGHGKQSGKENSGILGKRRALNGKDAMDSEGEGQKGGCGGEKRLVLCEENSNDVRVGVASLNWPPNPQ
ncbi:hypothetical protein RHGRI_021705 [Rhododendron griersonianum]|uniref:Uncharacterized protein n=1 Tax=Rhododendron griersonianum TaxID=479676 RepID=A0AAV6JPP1_9ERIC|nr:hypothetical protein RHGRI_021705 [Rhododendron griersonianum]